MIIETLEEQLAAAHQQCLLEACAATREHACDLARRGFSHREIERELNEEFLPRLNHAIRSALAAIEADLIERAERREMTLH